MRLSCSLALAFLSCLNLALTPSQGPLPSCLALVTVVVCLLGRRPAAAPPVADRADRWLAAGLFVLALTVRLASLEQCPPLPSTDEGINGDIALEILQGRGPGPLLSGFGVSGEEAAVFYLHALSFRLFGPSLTAFRLPAAVAGALLLPLLYFLCRQRCGRAASALACAVCAVNPAHLLFSRMANSIVYPVTFQALVFLWLPRVLEHRRPVDFALLGLWLGLGLNTYPSFRIVAPIVLGLLAWEAWRGRDKGGLALGVALAAAVTATLLTPQLATPECRAAYLARLSSITVAGQTPFDAVRIFLGALPSTLGAALGLTSPAEGFLLVSPAVGALALVGLLACLPERRPGAGRAPGALAASLLPALLLTGLLPPLVTVFEPAATRRFLLLLVPLHLLLAMGLDGVLRPRFGAASRLPWLFPAAGLLFGACLMSGQRHALARIGCNLESRPLELSLACSAARLSCQRTVVLTRASVRQPFIAGRQTMAPELNFFLRGFPLNVAYGLNPYPILEPVERVDFVLAQPEWQAALRRAFPGGRPADWRDPDNPDQCLRLFTVDGQEAFGLQGLDEQRHGEARGAVYLGGSGHWAFELDAVRGWLKVGDQTSPVRAGRARLAGWYSEGWHPLAYTGRPGPIRLAWQPPEASGLHEVLRMNLLKRMPGDPQLWASPLAANPIGLAPVSGLSWPEERPTGQVQAAAIAGGRAMLLRPGPSPLAPFVPDAAWRGLRDRQGRALALAEQVASSGFLHSLAATPEGRLFIADAVEGRLLAVEPDGLVRLELRFGMGECLPSSLDFDPVTRQLLVTDAREGRLFALDERLRSLSEWRCPGVTAACWGRRPGTVHAIVARRGGLVRLEAGRETAFWRMVEATTLSRIACDGAGRVAVLASLGRLQVFDAGGRILLPLTRLPGPDGRAADGPPPFGVAIVALAGGDLAVACAGVSSTWMRLSLGRSPDAPFRHEMVARPR